MVIIVDNGDPATHIDIAIIGSGFTTAEIPDFVSKVAGNVSKMWLVNWFADNEPLFNIYRVDAESPVSGEDLDEATIYSLVSGIPYDILVVIHNYEGQESVVNPYIDLYTGSHDYVVLAHELGHVIGKLDDEYYTPATAYKCDGLSKRTLNIHDKPNNEKWSDLISTPPFEGARFCEVGLWRPSELTIMKDSANTTVFDAVGYKAMDLGAGKIIGTISSTQPGLEISGVQNDDTKSGILDVEAVTSSLVGIERVEFYWAKAGDISKSIKFDRAYPYEISIDTTQYENGQYYLDTIAYDVNWNYIRVTRLFNILNISGLDIPIIVQEALTQDSEYYIEHEVRQDMPGMNRINEPLTVGVPLTEDSGITNITQLGLSGATIQQFRILKTWPNGNAKWVLVDTQVDILADDQSTINLVEGIGNFGGNDIATDNGDHISIDTGVAQFKIKKSNFNFIDEAIVDGVTLVSTGNNGGVSMVGHDDATYILDSVSHTLVIDATYDSKNDANSTATIEENGPVRTVIKATGSFKDVSGNRFLDYTVRFHFYKDKSFVKPVIIIRHGQEEEHENEFGGYNQVNRIFSSMQATIPMNLGVTKTFTFAGRTSDIQGAVDESAYMFQAYSEAHKSSIIEDDVKDGNWDWLFPPMEKTTEYVQKGFKVQNGAITLNPLSDEYDWTRGYAEIKDQDDTGLTLAMKYMSAYWPTSFEFGADGVVEIGIYSKHNSKNDIEMGWGTHESRELMLDFHVAPVNNLEFVYRLEQPIVGRNSVFHYGNTKAFFESEGIVSEDQFNQFFIDNYGEVDYFHPKSLWHQTNTGVVVWRTFWYSGVAGTDLPMSSLYAFLKTGMGGRYMSSLQKTIYNTDSAVIRSDGFDYSGSIIKTSYEYPIITTGSYNSGGGQNRFDYYGHNHWRAMPFFYYLTGNEEIKDSINDYLEEFVKKGPLINLDSMRSHARFCSTLALGYEFNLDERLMTILEEMIGELLSSRDNPPNMEPPGRNMERGYLSMDAEYWGEPTIHSFFLASIHSQDIWQVLRVIKKLNPTYSRTIEIDDYLLGVSQFMYHELHFEAPVGNDFGFTYNHRLNTVNEWIDGVVEGNYMRKDDCSRAMLHAYINSGNEMYLTRGVKYLAFGGGVGSSTPYPGNDLIYANIHGIDEVWRYVETFTKSNVGKDYTLEWIVPDDTVAYKIKYSKKPIVDWLNYDQSTQVFEYSPDNNTPFFAATNLVDSINPANGGSLQTTIVDIEAEIANYNTINGLSPDNPSYLVYDPEVTYEFSIKYLSVSDVVTVNTDLNEDSIVDLADYNCMIRAIGKSLGQGGYNQIADYNSDDKVTYSDFKTWYSYYNA